MFNRVRVLIGALALAVLFLIVAVSCSSEPAYVAQQPVTYSQPVVAAPVVVATPYYAPRTVVRRTVVRTVNPGIVVVPRTRYVTPYRSYSAPRTVVRRMVVRTVRHR